MSGTLFNPKYSYNTRLYLQYRHILLHRLKLPWLWKQLRQYLQPVQPHLWWRPRYQQVSSCNLWKTASFIHTLLYIQFSHQQVQYKHVAFYGIVWYNVIKSFTLYQTIYWIFLQIINTAKKYLFKMFFFFLFTQVNIFVESIGCEKFGIVGDVAHGTPVEFPGATPCVDGSLASPEAFVMKHCYTNSSRSWIPGPEVNT